MILIADSGATKTDWCLGKKTTDARVIQTQGINPFHQSAEHIYKVLTEELLPQLGEENHITHIHFYGAGCTPEKSVIVKEQLQALFLDADIDVQSDLLGAARSLCGKEQGIACILGTGSNSCLYDGEKIIANVSPLGYILGDEGSGAVLGKRLVGDCLKHQLPEHICQAFLNETGLTPADIINKVYRQPQANRFLASLVPFIKANSWHPAIQDMLIGEFTRFLQRNVIPYDRPDLPINFVGGVANNFTEEITAACKACGLKIGKIIARPAIEMQKYHFYVI